MVEMRVGVGVKESTKKKLAWITWAGHVDKMGDEKNGKEIRCPENAGEMEARKNTEIAMGDCIESDLERVGEEWKTMTDRMSRRLLTENVLREK